MINLQINLKGHKYSISLEKMQLIYLQKKLKLICPKTKKLHV